VSPEIARALSTGALRTHAQVARTGGGGGPSGYAARQAAGGSGGFTARRQAAPDHEREVMAGPVNRRLKRY
jgi:hypothetical protein